VDMNALACAIRITRIRMVGRGKLPKCRDFWSPQDYKFYAENPINQA